MADPLKVFTGLLDAIGEAAPVAKAAKPAAKATNYFGDLAKTGADYFADIVKAKQDVPKAPPAAAAPVQTGLKLVEAPEGGIYTPDQIKTAKGEKYFRALDPDGNTAAEMLVRIDGKTARIEDILNPNAVREEGVGTIGNAQLLDLIRQFRKQHPDVTEFTGKRVSGARSGGEYSLLGEPTETSVKLHSAAAAGITGAAGGVAMAPSDAKAGEADLPANAAPTEGKGYFADLLEPPPATDSKLKRVFIRSPGDEGALDPSKHSGVGRVKDIPGDISGVFKENVEDYKKGKQAIGEATTPEAKAAEYDQYKKDLQAWKDKGSVGKPKRVDGRVIWDRLKIEAAFTDLPDDNRVNPLDRMLEAR